MERICFVSPYSYGYFNPDHGYTGGGAERQIYHLSTNLTDRFDVHVVVGDYGQPETEHRDGVTLHRAYPRQPRQTPIQPVRFSFKLAHAMRQADADIYVHRGEPKNAAVVYTITRLLGRKFVYNLANDANIRDRPSSLSKPMRWQFSRALVNADSIIAQTEHQQTRLQQTYNVDSTVVPNGYPTSESQPKSYSERTHLLWVGSLDKDQKRPHLYLDLAEKLPEYSFRFIGPINESNNYKKDIADRGRNLENVEVVGAVSPTEIHQHYRTALAFINTSAYEGFPNTFLEAWREGTPVLSLDIGLNRYAELPAPASGDCSGDIDQLAADARDLVTDETTWRRCSNSSLDCFHNQFAIETIAEAYGDVLVKALS